MPADVMNSKFVRRPFVVCVATISKPVVGKKNAFSVCLFVFFHDFFFVFVNTGSHRSKNFKAYLLPIGFELFQIFYEWS